MENFELNDSGLRVWRHKTNKRLFLEQQYGWVDKVVMLDETEGRQVIDIYRASTYNFGAWEPVTQDEYKLVKQKYTDIYGNR